MTYIADTIRKIIYARKDNTPIQYCLKIKQKISDQLTFFCIYFNKHNNILLIIKLIRLLLVLKIAVFD